MSEWGLWGYAGIVVGMLALLALVFLYVEPVAQRHTPNADVNPDEARQGGKHAA